ncbi:MAG: 2-oxo acid dehydrogenase subunit E2 [Rhodocyclaceae bacterium]|nr:2-oxo acid dehydrogenase subunit E2 [Rhodocyclaceae bacterium]
MGRLIELVVPALGDLAEVPVIDLPVTIGQTIRAGDPIATLESDKAAMDVPASTGGVVTELLVALGDPVSEGSPLLRIEGVAPAAASSPARGGTPASTDSPVGLHPRSRHDAPAGAAPGRRAAGDPPRPARRVRAAPAVRRLARELGVALDRVRPGEPAGRIAREDIIAHVKAVMQAAAAPAGRACGEAALGLPPWPTIDFEKFGPVERQPRSRIRKRSAANLHRNWVTIPHVTNFDEADITDLEAFRVQINREKREGDVKLSPLAFVIKAAVHALQALPAFNSSIDGDDVIVKHYWHIDFAADTSGGLVVPVIRDADRKSVAEIARECARLAGLARDGRLAPEHMTGGTFTVSSLGGIGGTGFTPIINAPEVAILGVTRGSLRPVWDGDAFRPRRILPLCLSWDHRVVDGAAAAGFLAHLARLLGDLRRLLV